MRRLPGAALAALALVLAGCGGTQAVSVPTAPATRAPALSPSQSPPSPSPAGDAATFSSTVYDYTLDVPANWTRQPATTAWTGGDIDHTAEYADRFTDASDNVYFILGTQTDLDAGAFADDHLAWLSSERGCPAPTRRASMTVDATTAIRASIHCPEGIFGPTLVSKVITVHDGDALILTAFSPDTGSDAMPSLDALASSLRWSVS